LSDTKINLNLNSETMKKINFLLITFFFLGIVQAQEKYSFTFNHIALSVKSLDESATFYTDIF